MSDELVIVEGDLEKQYQEAVENATVEPNEFRNRLVAMVVNEGQSVKKVAEANGVSYYTLRNWVRYSKGTKPKAKREKHLEEIDELKNSLRLEKSLRREATANYEAEKAKYEPLLNAYNALVERMETIQAESNDILRRYSTEMALVAQTADLIKSICDSCKVPF